MGAYGINYYALTFSELIVSRFLFIAKEIQLLAHFLVGKYFYIWEGSDQCKDLFRFRTTQEKQPLKGN